MPRSRRAESATWFRLESARPTIVVLMQGWLASTGDDVASAEMCDAADRAFLSFNRRFWNPTTRRLFDVIDGESGDDAACRPNQVFAISLPHAVLAQEHWAEVLTTVEQELLTPVGGVPPGDRLELAHRPYIDTWLRVHPTDVVGARRALEGLIAHLGESCIGFVGEVFDAEEPFTPGGCAGQAWGVAELLGCLLLVER